MSRSGTRDSPQTNNYLFFVCAKEKRNNRINQRKLTRKVKSCWLANRVMEELIIFSSRDKL